MIDRPAALRRGILVDDILLEEPFPADCAIIVNTRDSAEVNILEVTGIRHGHQLAPLSSRDTTHYASTSLEANTDNVSQISSF